MDGLKTELVFRSFAPVFMSLRGTKYLFLWKGSSEAELSECDNKHKHTNFVTFSPDCITLFIVEFCIHLLM